MKNNLTLGILMLLSLALKAQETFAPPTTSPQVKAKSTQLTMRIDGILDEADWSMAERIHAFVQKDPVQGNAASMPTEVKILFDQENLYVGAYCKVPRGRKDIRAQNLQRDFDYNQNDLFGIAIDGFLDKRNCVAFQTNPYGAQREILVMDDEIFNGEWSGLWRVRTQITDYSYLSHRVSYTGDFSKKIGLNAAYRFGKYFDGDLNTFSTSLRFAPLPHITITADYEWNEIKNLGVKRESLATHLVGAELRLALNPRIQWVNFYQYNTVAKRSALNSRLAWEYQPLSYIYLVYNDNQQDRIDPESGTNNRIHNQQGVLKLTFL